MMIWAPLAKSPNWASHTTSASGIDRVPVLEAHHRVLREQRVVDPEPPRPVAQMGQGHPLRAGVVVDEDGVALAEGAPPGVLARQAHVGALEDQGPEGQASPRAQSISPSATILARCRTGGTASGGR